MFLYKRREIIYNSRPVHVLELSSSKLYINFVLWRRVFHVVELYDDRWYICDAVVSPRCTLKFFRGYLVSRSKVIKSHFLTDKENNAPNDKIRREYARILRTEESRRCWRAINTSRGKKPQNGISAVDVNINGTWTRITKQDEVENAIMKNNSARFNLTVETPLMQPSVTANLGYLADSSLAQEILDGKYEPNEDLDPYTNTFLSYIGTRQALPTLPAAITADDFKSYWKAARERTASSLSGRHFGHYKAAATSPFLCNIHASFQSAASQYGIYMSRWTKGLTVMLEKVENVIRVDKLRAILLMEADFNFINKLIFGHRMVQQCERQQRFPNELYGSRNKRSAIEVALNRRLTLENLKQKRCNGAIAGVDAAQCYDRIVHSLAIILCRNEGAPISSLLLMFGAIQSMEFFIRTTFGESPSSYGGVQDVPFQGSCQGNGASPALWLILSMYLVLLYKENGHSSKCRTAYSGVIFSIMGFLFVDDTDLVIFGAPSESMSAIRQRLQQSIFFWNGMLQVTGGALRAEKCYWYPIEFEWNNGISSIKNPTEGEIVLVSASGSSSVIQRKSPSDAMEAVGVWQDATGANSKQLDILIEKIQSFHTAMEAKPLPRHLCWMALRHALWRSIDYVLPAISLSQDQAHSLAKELYRPILPKLGCNRNFPLLLRYNPPSLMGLGLSDPYVEQGLSKLNLFQTHAGTTSITGHLIQTLLEQHQLEIGSFTSLFHLPYKQYSYLTSPSWIIELWQFVDNFDIILQSHDAIKLHGARTHDVAIMDAVRELGPIIPAQLKAFNRVRCHLHVMNLSDVTTGDGKRIDTVFFDSSPPCLDSAWEWHLEHPTQQDYKVWRRYLKSLLDATNSLFSPLGKWIAQSHQNIKWFYSPSTDRIYERNGPNWKLYDRTSRPSRLQPQFAYNCTSPVSPFNVTPTTVTVLHPNLVLFHGTSPSTDYFHLPHCMQLTELNLWAIKNSSVHSHYNDEWLLNGLRSGTLHCVCDGSYKPFQSTTVTAAAWVMESSCHRFQISGELATKSIAADAYRGELLGIYAVLTALAFLEASHPDHDSWSLRIGCDNERAGWMSRSLHHVSPTTKHMDLVRAIRHTCGNLSTSVSFYHLYGHQDDTTPLHLLPRDVQLNVQVDAMAQQHLDMCILHNTCHRQPTFNNEHWHVIIGGIKLQDSVSYHLRRWIGKQNLRRYLYQRGLISWTGFTQIDWEPLELFMHSQSVSFHLWFSKHWSNFCGIGSTMKVMGYWPDDLCPCCKKVTESSTTHLFLCDHVDISSTREKEFHAILKWLESVDTAPIVLHLISAFWYGRAPQLDADDPYICREIYAAMQEMGVSSMWMGLLPVHLTDLQDSHYKMIGSQRSGQRWGRDLVGKMVRATHHLWLTCNSILHATTTAGIKGHTYIELQDLVLQQLRCGVEHMSPEDHYLIEMPVDVIMAGNIESIRGWLCSVLIARGNVPAARDESTRDRDCLSYTLPRLTAQQQQAYLNWRNVHLTPLED